MNTVITPKYAYPAAHKAEVVEDYHGTAVADPYRWLEDPESPETRAFTAAQNALTESFLSGNPDRARIGARLAKLWGFPQYGPVTKKKDRYFFTLYQGLQNQPVLYVQSGLEGEPRPLLDPNRISEDGTVALITQSYTEDGSLLAYGLSTSGSDWQEVRVREVANGEDYPDVIRWTKFANLAWAADRSGFFYNRLPEPGSVPTEDQNHFSQVFWHRLGDSQAEDTLIYEDPERKELSFEPLMDDDGAVLLLYVYHGTDHRNGIYYYSLKGDGLHGGDVVQLLEVGEARFDPLGNHGATFYFLTDLEAPRGQIIAIDLERPQRENWVTLVPEDDDALDFAALVNDHFVVAAKRDAHHRLLTYTLAGELAREIDLPTLGAVEPFQGGRDDGELFLLFTSFTYPPTPLRYDFASGLLAPFKAVQLGFDASRYATTQVFYPSKDGTRVPMFLTHRVGLQLDGNNPTLLYGYGGFNISLTPFFKVPPLVWLEQGGVYAVANLRGGDEYGEEWHQAGMLERKQNVFDDFIAAGEWLIEQGYTSRSRLVIEGRSNGGLLVAACAVQRPDLYGAVLCNVPVVDMLRYHRFTVGSYWIPEYGDAENDPEHFRFLYAYSPLHNVKPGAAYPPMLITSADTDDRVVPAHAKKFAATLQALAPGGGPTLLRVETKAGHGMGKPVSKLIEESADIYAFAFKISEMSWKENS